MIRRRCPVAAPIAGVLVFALAAVAGAAPQAGTARPSRTPAISGGQLTGHVTLQGRAPGNPVIRMTIDPACADLTRGRQVIQQQALVTREGGVANVFVRLEGTFPATPIPAAPVVIEQRACVYAPRVVGVRVGQRLQMRNDDNLLHNVHSLSAAGNSFNVGQPRAGLVFEFTPRAPELMLALGCDVHRWMKAFVGVMPHPYFAVTDASGAYTITNVPPGRYTLFTWHEQFGVQSQTVVVRPGIASSADVAYPPVGGRQ